MSLKSSSFSVINSVKSANTKLKEEKDIVKILLKFC